MSDEVDINYEDSIEIPYDAYGVSLWKEGDVWLVTDWNDDSNIELIEDIDWSVFDEHEEIDTFNGLILQRSDFEEIKRLIKQNGNDNSDINS